MELVLALSSIRLVELLVAGASRAADASARRAVVQRQTRLRGAEVDDLVSRYRAGESVRVLAERFGVHRTTVMSHLERRGVPRRPAVAKLSEGDIRDAACFYAAGLSLASVADRFGVNAKTVAAALGRVGTPMRPRKGGPSARA